MLGRVVPNFGTQFDVRGRWEIKDDGEMREELEEHALIDGCSSIAPKFFLDPYMIDGLG
jgi:hypothetical protein